MGNMIYRLLQPPLFLLNRLPLGALRATGQFLGALVWKFSAERRHVAVTNARIIGAENPEKTARKSFDYTFVSYMEMFYAHRVDKEFIRKRVVFEGLDNFYKLREKIDNFVLVGAHFGAWAMLATIVSQGLDIKMITVGRSSKNKALNRIMDELRTFPNIAYITHRGAMAQLPKYMEQGYFPGVYIDHTAMPKDCVNVPFFGFKAPMIAGIPALCARKNIPALPFFGAYDEGGYKIMIYPPIYPDKNLKPKERIEKLATDINRAYEDVFGKYPAQWYLIHRRFKRVEEPDGTISDRVYRQGRDHKY